MKAISGTDASRRPSLREEQRALTRSRLRAGARVLFAEKPFYEVTIDEIAARSGVARATFYLHYESKKAVLRDILSDVMAAHRGLYHRLADLGVDPGVEELAAWLKRYLRAFRDQRAFLALFNLVIGSDPAFLVEITRERDALFDDVGARSPAFAFGEGSEGTVRRMGAHLLVFKVEQFCSHCVSAGWGTELQDIGIGLLTIELKTFLSNARPV